MTENARMHMNMDGEFCNPKIAPNMVSIITINITVMKWRKSTRRPLIIFCVSINEVLMGVMGCFPAGLIMEFLRDSKGRLFWISLKPLCRIDRARGGEETWNRL